jgi:hypothetical protein
MINVPSAFALLEQGEGAMAVTVESDTADGKHYRITLEKVGADTGTVDVTTWKQGQDPQASPGSKQTYAIHNAKAADDGSKLVCQTHVLFFSPTITVAIHAPAAPQPPFIRIDINGANPTDYPVSDADEERLRQFLVGCHFPAL